MASIKENQSVKEFITTELLQVFEDFRIGLAVQKNYYKAFAIVISITGLFLGINSSSIFLRRVQALGLLLSVLGILIIYCRIIYFFFKQKHTELYYAFSLMFMFMGGLLTYNLLRYLAADFKYELEFYLKWLVAPLFSILVNILAVYFFKLLAKVGKTTYINGPLENFFLISLNLYLVLTFQDTDYDVKTFFARLISVNYYSISLLYYFFIALYDELFIIERLKNTLASRSMHRVVVVLYVIILYILPSLIYHASALWYRYFIG